MKLFILLFFISFNTLASGWIDIHLTTKHENKYYVIDKEAKEYNANNGGIGLTYDLNSTMSVKGGFYNNSYYINSNYVSIDLHTNYKHFNVGADIGMVTGYRGIIDDNYATPLLLPNLTAKNKYAKIQLGYIPAFLAPNDTAIYTLTASTRF